MNTERVFCSLCRVTFEAERGAEVKCKLCGNTETILHRFPTPDEPETIQDMRQDRCDTESLAR